MPSSSTEWNESNPSNSDLVNEGDDEIRAVKGATRARMAVEHVWPASQAAVNEAGLHKYITFQGQTAAPTLVVGTNTQLGAIYVSSGSKHLLFEDSAGTTYVIGQSGQGIPLAFGGTGSIGSIPIVTSGGSFAQLVASATNSVCVSIGATLAPTFKVLSTVLVISAGSTANGATIGLPAGVNSNEVQAITVGMNADTSAIGTSCPDGVAGVYSVDVNRVVTSKWISINNSGVSGNAIANYVVFAIVTH